MCLLDIDELAKHSNNTKVICKREQFCFVVKNRKDSIIKDNANQGLNNEPLPTYRDNAFYCDCTSKQ